MWKKVLKKQKKINETKFRLLSRWAQKFHTSVEKKHVYVPLNSSEMIQTVFTHSELVTSE